VFKRVVDVVEVLALAAAVVFAVCLFLVGGEGGESGGAGEAAPGQAVFADNCASCHGADGAGGIGPQLSDGAVVEAFPDAADQAAVIADGRNGMPAFADRLTADDIAAVTEYTRGL